MEQTLLPWWFLDRDLMATISDALAADFLLRMGAAIDALWDLFLLYNSLTAIKVYLPHIKSESHRAENINKSRIMIMGMEKI